MIHWRYLASGRKRELFFPSAEMFTKLMISGAFSRHGIIRSNIKVAIIFSRRRFFFDVSRSSPQCSQLLSRLYRVFCSVAVYARQSANLPEARSWLYRRRFSCSGLKYALFRSFFSTMLQKQSAYTEADCCD